METSPDRFTGFLKEKKIDPDAFRSGLPLMWAKWNADFAVTSTASFDLRVKFLLNNLRLEFPLTEVPAEKQQELPPVTARPRPLMRKAVSPPTDPQENETT
jgi:hypothetical protein